MIFSLPSPRCGARIRTNAQSYHGLDLLAPWLYRLRLLLLLLLLLLQQLPLSLELDFLLLFLLLTLVLAGTRRQEKNPNADRDMHVIHVLKVFSYRETEFWQNHVTHAVGQADPAQKRGVTRFHGMLFLSSSGGTVFQPLPGLHFPMTPWGFVYAIVFQIAYLRS